MMWGIALLRVRWFVVEKTLSAIGVPKAIVFLGMFCQFRPPRNDLKRFLWTGPEIPESLSRLRIDLANFRPHMCSARRCSLKSCTRRWTNMCVIFFGSLFVCNDPASPFFGLKCMPTLTRTIAKVLSSNSAFSALTSKEYWKKVCHLVWSCHKETCVSTLVRMNVSPGCIPFLMVRQ